MALFRCSGESKKMPKAMGGSTGTDKFLYVDGHGFFGSATETCTYQSYSITRTVGSDDVKITIPQAATVDIYETNNSAGTTTVTSMNVPANTSTLIGHAYANHNISFVIW